MVHLTRHKHRVSHVAQVTVLQRVVLQALQINVRQATTARRFLQIRNKSPAPLVTSAKQALVQLISIPVQLVPGPLVERLL